MIKDLVAKAVGGKLVLVCPTEEIYNKLMSYLENNTDHNWIDGQKPTDERYRPDTNYITIDFFAIGIGRSKHPKKFDGEVVVISESDFEDDKPVKIIIKSDGYKTVTAYCDKFKAIASCCPDDKFDLLTGCKIAVKRLVDKMENKEESYPVGTYLKVGDTVEIVKETYNFDDVGHTGVVVGLRNSTGYGGTVRLDTFFDGKKEWTYLADEVKIIKRK